jgi:hypothetical protein
MADKNPMVILLNHIQTLLHGAGYTVQYKGNWADPEQDTLVVGRGADVFTVRVFHVPKPPGENRGSDRPPDVGPRPSEHRS